MLSFFLQEITFWYLKYQMFHQRKCGVVDC